MTNRIFKSIFAAGVALGLLGGVAAAQSHDKRTAFTFNRPISVPGITLPAGTYVFRLVGTDGTRKVVQVLSGDGKTPYAMLHSIPDARAEASSSPEVRFLETAKGTPSAVKTWWYPGERIGYEFIYPKEQARLLARESTEPVLTTRVETKKPEETKLADLERLAPSGQEVAVTPEPEPAPAPVTGIKEEGTIAEARTTLPVTATNLPLVGLIGLLALAAAGGLRLSRTGRA